MFTSVDQLSSISQLNAQTLGAVVGCHCELCHSPIPKLEPERQNFKSLILENPNYFGNLEGSVFKPVKPMKGNSSYEDLACAGLQTQLDRLEAVINIKRTAGYGGTICQAGSFEFVRFFVDLHDNGIFTDVGLTSVNVHDIPGAKPLCYAVYLDFTPIRKLCIFENVVKVRAILSWNAVPPSNPNFVPVWGSVLDAEVQIRPTPFLLLGDVVQQITDAKVKLPDPVGPVISALNPETKLACRSTSGAEPSGETAGLRPGGSSGPPVRLLRTQAAARSQCVARCLCSLRIPVRFFNSAFPRPRSAACSANFS